jgi:hypothetical protein
MNEARRSRPPRLDAGAVISLRLAATGDEAALEQLAELSGRAKALGPWIVAEVDGRLWAALPLAGGEPLADPFRPTVELRALLTLRAKQLGHDERVPRDSARRRRRRFRSTPALADHSRLP